MPGWAGSDRRAELPRDWHITQPRILMRDNHQCQVIRTDTNAPCLAPARQVDHIENQKSGGSEDDSNLAAICDWHHDRKSGREGGLASGAARRAKAKREAPRHPGVLP